MEFGFPEMSLSYLHGQDIFYSQFNDIDFYIEDKDQENFYFEIIKKLFSDVKIEKIFPQGGKEFVIAEAINNTGNKKKVHLVDLDFDKILGKKVEMNNLFYLEKYSIENYLFEIEAIINFIKEEKPKYKPNHNEISLLINSWLSEAKELLSLVTNCHIVVQCNNLAITNVDYGIEKFCDYKSNPAKLKEAEVSQYLVLILQKLNEIDSSLDLNNELLKTQYHFSTLDSFNTIVPGKHLLLFIKNRVESYIKIRSLTVDSFSYRLAKNSKFESLFFLKQSILQFIRN